MMSSINVRYHSPLLLNILCLSVFVYFSKLFNKKEVPNLKTFFKGLKHFAILNLRFHLFHFYDFGTQGIIYLFIQISLVRDYPTYFSKI